MFTHALKITFSALIIIAASSILGLIFVEHTHSANGIRLWLLNYWWVLAIWRYCILSVLIWQWPRICRWWGKRHKLAPSVINQLIGYRWWLTGFIILFEIVVVYGV